MTQSNEHSDAMREAFERSHCVNATYRDATNEGRYLDDFLQQRWVGYQVAIAHERKLADKLASSLNKCMNFITKQNSDWDSITTPDFILDALEIALKHQAARGK